MMKLLAICGILACLYFGWVVIQKEQLYMLPLVFIGILLWANILDLPRRQAKRWAKADEEFNNETM